MPELPEVETVCRGLANTITGRQITEVLARRRHLRVPLPDNMEQALTGRTVQQVTRRAKYILVHLDNQTILVIHLGMSGTLVLHQETPLEYRKHDHVVITFQPDMTLIFHDPRRFGLIALMTIQESAGHPLFAGLGLEPFDQDMTAGYFHALLKKSRSPVKLAIMDQRKIVGVGNIYASESLFRSGIHPARPADSITQREAGVLRDRIITVLNEAIASGGSTLRDYVRSSGDSGYFQHHFTVYGRHGQPCTNCSSPIKQMKQSGRSTFFCNICQR